MKKQEKIKKLHKAYASVKTAPDYIGEDSEVIQEHIRKSLEETAKILDEIIQEEQKKENEREMDEWVEGMRKKIREG